MTLSSNRRTAVRAVTALVMLTGLWLTGCDKSETDASDDQTTQNDTPALSKLTEEGPVKAEVSLTPANPRLGDPLSLRLTVTAQPFVTVEMPAFGEALGRFSILDFTPRRRVETDGVTVATQTYTLQAPMSGQQRIPPLRMEYLDSRDAAPDTSENYRELLTEELTVQIASVLPVGAVTDTLKPARALLPELGAGLLARLWPWLVAGLVALAGVLWLTAQWQKRALVQARLTAFDRALERLNQLEQTGLPGGEAADVWYVELSDIVRRYIEDQYGVRAPELTTEEFLQEAQRSAQLSGPHRTLLSEFLERCDRVKFAAYAPAADESREALALARRFLGETRAVAEPHERLAA